MKPNGNNGSSKQSRRDGDGTNWTSIGTYARKRPSGRRKFKSDAQSATPSIRFAPAESPIKKKVTH